MIKYLYEHFLYLYCLFLVLMSGIFLGSEINMIQHSQEIKHANDKLKQCNMIVVKGNLYE